MARYDLELQAPITFRSYKSNWLFLGAIILWQQQLPFCQTYHELAAAQAAAPPTP